MSRLIFAFVVTTFVFSLLVDMFNPKVVFSSVYNLGQPLHKVVEVRMWRSETDSERAVKRFGAVVCSKHFFALRDELDAEPIDPRLFKITVKVNKLLVTSHR